MMLINHFAPPNLQPFLYSRHPLTTRLKTEADYCEPITTGNTNHSQLRTGLNGWAEIELTLQQKMPPINRARTPHSQGTSSTQIADWAEVIARLQQMIPPINQVRTPNFQSTRSTQIADWADIVARLQQKMPSVIRTKTSRLKAWVSTVAKNVTTGLLCSTPLAAFLATHAMDSHATASLLNKIESPLLQNQLEKALQCRPTIDSKGKLDPFGYQLMAQIGRQSETMATSLAGKARDCLALRGTTLNQINQKGGASVLNPASNSTTTLQMVKLRNGDFALSINEGTTLLLFP
jgi:hypothetical protein